MSSVKRDVVEQLRRVAPRDLILIANRASKICDPAGVVVMRQCRCRAETNVDILVGQRLPQHR